MFSPIEEIKNKIDVVELIGSYIKVEKAGVNFRALCPFHGEKTPSFFISPSRQIWHCFGGCGEGGDIFKFIMKYENVDFKEALKVLAQKAGVVLVKEDPKLRNEKTQLFEICEEATKLFENNLKKNKEAFDYLKNRGLNDETIKEFRIGFADESFKELESHLSELGYKIGDIEKAGLIIKRQEGNGLKLSDFYDRFRNRIMFPLFNSLSQVVGFSGRIFELPNHIENKDLKIQPAKYINSPSTLLYNKSYLLYGFDKAKQEIRKKDFCLLVEGQMDLIMCHQAGVKNSVAVSGTALTDFHLNTLKRLTENLIVAFDADLAGEKASQRGIDLARSIGFNVKVLSLSEAKDPAEFIQKKSSQEFFDEVLKAKSIMEFYFERAMEKYNLQIDDEQERLIFKKEIAKILLPQIKLINNKIEQGHWIEKLSEAIGVKEEYLKEEMNKIKDNNYSYIKEKPQESKPSINEKPSRYELLAERIIILFFKYPDKILLIKDFDIDKFISLADSKFIPKSFLLLSCFKKYLSIDEFGRNIPEELKEYKSILEFKSESFMMPMASNELQEVEKEINFCLKELKNNFLKERLNYLGFEIKKMESSKDPKVSALMQDFNSLLKEIS